MAKHTHQLGAANELRAASYFLEEGYNVYWPAVQQSLVDFVIEKAGYYQRVQVKSATWNSPRPTTTYLRLPIKTSAACPYLPDSFDLLVGVHKDRLWIFPWEEVCDQGSILLGKQGDPEWRWSKFAVDEYEVSITGEEHE